MMDPQLQSNTNPKIEAPIVKTERALENYELAVGLYEKKDYKAAAEAFDKFLKEPSGSDNELVANAQFFRARTHTFLGESESARKLFEAFNKNPDFQTYTNLQREAQFRQAEILLNANKYGDAEKILLALSKDPHTAKAPYAEWNKFYLGQCYAEQGKQEAAINEFSALLAEGTSKQVRIEAHAQFALSSAKLAAPNWEACDETLANLEKIAPNSNITRETFLSLAMIAEKQDDFSRAGHFYKKASDAYKNAYEDSKQSKEMAEYCTISAKYHEAKVLEKQGKTKEAFALYYSCVSEAKTISGEDTQIAEAHKIRLTNIFEKALVLCQSEQDANSLFTTLTKNNPKLEIGVTLQTSGIQHYNTWVKNFGKNSQENELKIAYYLVRTAIEKYPETRANEKAGEAIRYAGCVLALENKDSKSLAIFAADFEKRYPTSTNLAYIRMLGAQAESEPQVAMTKLAQAIEGLEKNEALKFHLPYAKILLAQAQLKQADLLTAQTKPDAALELLEKVHQEHPRTELAGISLVKKAQILAGQGKSEAAIEIFSRVEIVYEEYPNLLEQAKEGLKKLRN